MHTVVFQNQSWYFLSGLAAQRRALPAWADSTRPKITYARPCRVNALLARATASAKALAIAIPTS